VSHLLQNVRIPDPWAGRRRAYVPCQDQAPDVYNFLICTRPEGHGGRHNASDGDNIRMVWGRW
jgi:hypothetical protein